MNWKQHEKSSPFPESNWAAIEAIIEMLDTCTTPQIKVIEDLVKAAKISLNQHF